MQIIKFFLILLLLLAFSCTTHKSQKNVTLSLHLQKGKTYRLASEIHQVTEQTVHDVKQKISMTIRGIMAFRLQSQRNHHYRIAIKYEDMHFKLSDPRMTVTFDSDKQPRPDNISDQVYARFVGKKFHLLLNQYGEIESISGLDSLGRAIMNDLDAKFSNKAVQARFFEDFKGLFGNQALEANLAVLFAFYPKHPVKIGESWSKTLDLHAPIPFTIENTFKLTAFDSTAAIIEGNGLFSSLRNASPTTVSGITLTYDVEGEQTSKIKARFSDGWVLSMKLESTLNGSINVEGSARLPHGMKIPIKITTQSVYRSLGN